MVYKRVVPGQALLVKDNAANRGLNTFGSAVGALGRDAHRHARLDVNHTKLMGHKRFVKACEHAALAFRTLLLGGKPIEASNHVLRGEHLHVARGRRA